MDYFEFYKDQYHKEIDRKNEISNSLSTPIGIISTLVAGLFYILTTFDFSLNPILTAVFVILVIVSLIFLGISIYHLIKAFSDFHNGFKYAYLNNSDVLDNYHKALKSYYKQTKTTDTSDAEFNEYLLTELIKTTSINQKNNDSKIYHRFVCNKYMINTFLTICLLLIAFGIDYGLQNTKQKIQKVEIDSTLNVNLNSVKNKIFIDSLINKSINMVNDDKNKKVEKPNAPQTKILQEGKDPKIERQTFSEQEKNKNEKEKSKDK
jgi:ribosomal protein L12E/L44/L45/RPP1/RPP2